MIINNSLTKLYIPVENFIYQYSISNLNKIKHLGDLNYCNCKYDEVFYIVKNGVVTKHEEEK